MYQNLRFKQSRSQIPYVTGNLWERNTPDIIDLFTKFCPIIGELKDQVDALTNVYWLYDLSYIGFVPP